MCIICKDGSIYCNIGASLLFAVAVFFFSYWMEPSLLNCLLIESYTVNLEIFARTLFSRNFAYAKFRENKIHAKWQNSLSFIDIRKPCLSRQFFTSLICLLMLFAKIKFTRKFPNLQYIYLPEHSSQRKSKMLLEVSFCLQDFRIRKIEK